MKSIVVIATFAVLRCFSSLGQAFDPSTDAASANGAGTVAPIMERAASYAVVERTSINIAGQGQVRFQTDLRPEVDVPVMRRGLYGPGPNFSAQLYVVGGTATAPVLTPLSPATTFRAAGSGADVVADRYVNPVDVTVPNVPPGANVTLIMRVWRTALGSFENALGTCDAGQSAYFTITVGGGDLPPAPLKTLQSFTLGHLACPRDLPRISGIALVNNKILITADQSTIQTRLFASTNLQTWTDLNLTSTISNLFAFQRTFSADRPLSSQYYRLVEP